MIPLASDTETRPSAAMRAAIAAAEVGDEQRGSDPTVNRLLERCAALLGKEAALFLPSGTMCNLVATKLHTEPGDVLLAEGASHVLRVESGGAGMVSGVMTEPITGSPGVPPGTFTVDDLDATLDRLAHLPFPYAPPARLVCIEQTHNMGGGTVWPWETFAAVTARARERGLAIHMDGARLMNAVVASGVAADRWGALVDTVWIDFTKGLGAPIGAVLAGSEAHIARARRLKHAFGGAMRQAGIAAAACLYALDEHIERLASDHANARRLAAGLARIPGIRRPAREPQTNIVFFEPAPGGPSAAQLVERCARRGLGLGAIGPRIRAVTHLDVSAGDIDQALAIIAEAIADG